MMRRLFIKTNEDLKNALSRSGLEFNEHDNASFYVTSFKFNIWIGVKEQYNLIHISTFHPIRLGSSAISVLTFSNRCNQELAIPQFCISPNFERFNGYYQFCTLDGVDARHIIKTASMFANDFYKAIYELDEDDIIGVNQEVDEYCAQRQINLLN